MEITKRISISDFQNLIKDIVVEKAFNNNKSFIGISTIITEYITPCLSHTPDELHDWSMIIPILHCRHQTNSHTIYKCKCEYLRILVEDKPTLKGIKTDLFQKTIEKILIIKGDFDWKTLSDELSEQYLDQPITLLGEDFYIYVEDYKNKYLWKNEDKENNEILYAIHNEYTIKSIKKQSVNNYDQGVKCLFPQLGIPKITGIHFHINGYLAEVQFIKIPYIKHTN